ncbi:MAG: hypothetical protein MJ249_01335 [Kiritimatiellae bacterium]|nr:hypothetical protein [Kiritimatiellia bacterium]
MFFLVAMMCLPARAGVEEIVCEGAYGGHLQGVCTDGTNIWWSFTVEIVKTDLSGKVLVSRKARSHQGDLCVKDGVVYVAAINGKFYMARTTLDAEAKKAKRPCWRARLFAAKRP